MLCSIRIACQKAYKLYDTINIRPKIASKFMIWLNLDVIEYQIIGNLKVWANKGEASGDVSTRPPPAASLVNQNIEVDDRARNLEIIKAHLPPCWHWQ